MTCFRTARSLISRNMSAAPPALTLMLSHYWGGLPPSQGSAEACHQNGFPGNYGLLLAATGFEFVEAHASFAIALIGGGLHQHLGLVAILIDTGAARKALSERDFRRYRACLYRAPEGFDAVGLAPTGLGLLRDGILPIECRNGTFGDVGRVRSCGRGLWLRCRQLRGVVVSLLGVGNGVRFRNSARILVGQITWCGL